MVDKITKFVEKRVSTEPPVADHFSGSKRVIDPKTGMDVVKIFSGDWYVTANKNEMLATILGSCVSACIRDPIAGVGGMNHFLLPGDEKVVTKMSEASRYGMYAMENLINAILKAGGQKDRLEIKIFGGGNVIKSTAKIGSKNAAFIRGFLKQEGLRIVAEDLEGDLPRRIHYFPDTGEVFMRKLRRAEDMIVLKEEEEYSKKITAKPVEGDVDLF
jgi:chemotaxis protein CheD